MNKFEADILSEEISKAYATDEVKRVFTPFSLVEDMLRDVDLHGDILVLSDLGFLPVLAERGVDFGRVTFIAHTQEQFDLATEYEVARVVLVGYNAPIKEMERQLVGMKFDVVVGNPPYGNLHLPILKKAVEHLTDDGISITIQPVRWLQDPLWRLKKSTDAKKMQSVLDGKIDTIQLVPGKEATKIFNADMGFDLGIFIINNAGGNFKYNTLSDHPNGIDLTTLSRLLARNTLNLQRYDGEMLHFVPVKTIAAGGSGRGFVGEANIHQVYGYFADGKSHRCKYGDGLTLEEAHRANKRRTSGKTIGSPVAVFSSAAEAKHFHDFIKLDAFRFFVFATTLDVNIQCEYLPYPSEDCAFKTPWSPKRFYEYFNITSEEQKYIESVMLNHPVFYSEGT